MKRLLLPLLAALALPTAVDANWVGKYPSEREAMEACTDWMIKGGQDEVYYRLKRFCFGEPQLRQILGIDENDRVKKIYEYW